MLQRVLLAYARWNNKVGYCQGFNVIAAVILDVMERQEDCALKVNPRSVITVTVSVTVTEALVLRLLLEKRGRITESIRILVPVDRMKQRCFQITTKQVRRSQQF